MDTSKMVEDIVAWFKNPKTLKGLALYGVVTLILALDFAYWAGAIETEALIIEEGGGVELNETEHEDVSIVTKVVLSESGSGNPAGIGPLVNSLISFSMNIEENGTKSIQVNLSWTSPRPGAAYGLAATGPNGEEFSGSGSGGQAQMTITHPGGNETLVGTWEVRVIQIKSTAGSTFTLEGTSTIEMECGPDGCVV